MAELERAERNDEGRAREWIARAVNAAPDPAWTAEGHVSDRWLPVSPSGKLDAFEWRVPVTGITQAAAGDRIRTTSAIATVTAAPLRLRANNDISESRRRRWRTPAMRKRRRRHRRLVSSLPAPAPAACGRVSPRRNEAAKR